MIQQRSEAGASTGSEMRHSAAGGITSAGRAGLGLNQPAKKNKKIKEIRQWEVCDQRLGWFKDERVPHEDITASRCGPRPGREPNSVGAGTKKTF